MIFSVLFGLFMLAMFGAACVLAVRGDEQSSDQIDSDAVARHIRLLQKTEGTYLHLRRGTRIP